MASGQGLHCLPLTKQFYLHSQMDLLTSSIRKSVHSLSDLSKISHENEILSRVGGGGEGGSTEPPNRSEFAPEEFVLAPDKSTSNGYPQHMF